MARRKLKFNFIKTKQFGGTGQLSVNDKKFDETDMPKIHISTDGLAETFDVGPDAGTQIDPGYEARPLADTVSLLAVEMSAPTRHDEDARP